MTKLTPTEFSQEQKENLRELAINLLKLLEGCKLPESKQLLEGGLRSVLVQVINSDNPKPMQEVPFFSLMARDYLPEEETLAYLNFYSMALYGELAFKNDEKE